MHVRCEKCGYLMAMIDSYELEGGNNIFFVCQECDHHTEVGVISDPEKPPKDKASEALCALKACAYNKFYTCANMHAEIIAQELRAKDNIISVNKIRIVEKDIKIERLSKRLASQEYNDDLSADRVKSLELEVEELEKEAHGYSSQPCGFCVIKDEQIEQLEERNEELTDLVVKWEASYLSLRRK